MNNNLEKIMNLLIQNGYNVKKENPGQISISLPYIYLTNNDRVKIFIVEIDNELHLADYGKTFEDFLAEDNNLDNSVEKIKNKSKNFNIDIDNYSLIKKTNINEIIFDLSNFIHLVSYIQVELL